MLPAYGIAEGSIGVVTPYALQANLMKNLLGEYKSVKIGTVEEFQGDERDIILVSTVRTDMVDAQFNADRRLSFIKCPHRINVATSRAK